jgi:lipopolysaccharide transport system ATP-binding protein
MSIIKVEDLGKKYIIGHSRRAEEAYRSRSLRDAITDTTRGFYQRLRHPLSPNRQTTELEEFWALKDLNFEIEPGDRVGIVGPNGAGKSTLLKILSRITEPTTGRVEISGRITSLLEVGTGFHPELSGRENIFLNGAILGMHRTEIKKRFDEIVDFAEIEKFLDTPVKRYSSGMYVRLAFAIAAHLEPEILIVDEVLAVGDAAFQKKCLGKMEDVSHEGRTVLFVSHNMAAIRQLSSVGMLLEGGRLIEHGPINVVCASYLSQTEQPTYSLADRSDRVGDGRLRFTDVTYKNDSNQVITSVETMHDLVIELGVRTQESEDLSNLMIAITFADAMKATVLTIFSDEFAADLSGLLEKGFLKVTIRNIPLRPGNYSVDLFASAPDTSPANFCDLVYGASKLTVTDSATAIGAKPIRPQQYGVFQVATFE